MKQLLITLLLLLTGVPMLRAQAEQRVEVLEYNGKDRKTPLEGVSVTVQNAPAQMSDAQGLLTLNFRTLKAGEAVTVRRIEKYGYEVFNREAVEAWTISGQQTFRLVLCRSERLKALTDQYASVASASYQQQWQREKDALDAARREGQLKEEEYNRRLQEAQDAFDQQLENLDLYVEKFAHFDLSELSEGEQQIIDLVQAGRLDEAIERYEQLNLLDIYKQQSSQIRNIDAARDSLGVIRSEKEAARDELRQVVDYMEQQKTAVRQ